MRKISFSAGASRARFALLFAGLWLLAPILAEAQTWTLQRSAARVLEVSAELSGARATAAVQQGELTAAGRWPNPRVEIAVGDRLGRETGDGGWKAQEYAIAQPIPLGGRLRSDRRAAAQALSAARAEIGATALAAEQAAAEAFHQFQRALEGVELARSQLDRAQEFREIAQRRAAAGDIAGREALRLEVLAAEAEAAQADALRETAAAAARFGSLLQLPAQPPVDLPSLTPPAAPPPLAQLQGQLQEHPALRAAQERIEAARSRLAAARAARIPDLELRLAREEELFDDGRGSAYSVGIEVEVPLWNTGRGEVLAGRGELTRAQEDYRLRLREHQAALAESYAQLTGLLARLARHERQVLEPAQRVLELTRRGYSAGELGLPELIDATEAERRAATEQRDLLRRARLQQAQLRRAAGLRLVEPGEDAL